VNSLVFLPALEQARRVARRELSPVELLEAHLARIAQLNPRLNAFVHVDAEGARRQARLAEAAVQHGDATGALHGVPLSIKSSVDVAGLRCEAGSRLREDNVAASDAPLVARLRAAGAVILGVTNVPEMLMAYETDNLLYGRTANPWDLTRTAGGSSGGESAAIAAGLSAGGVGSDGGGSIRVPAHFTGICGLKPTPGRVPVAGHFPQSLGPYAHLGVVGPMARTVADVRAFFEVTAGPDPADVKAAPAPVRRYAEEELRRVRIGYFEDDGPGTATAETRAAVRAAAQALAGQGFHVQPFKPDMLAEALELWWVFFGLTTGVLLRSMLAGREAEVSPTLRKFLDCVWREPELTRDQLLHAWMQRDALRIRLQSQMQQFPVLFGPVCAVPAFPHGRGGWTERDVNCRDVMRYCQWFNLTGNPGAVVPVGRSPEGLPIGVQVVARPYEDELALAIAEQIERFTPGAGFHAPPLS
jgi:Asp-tRNA(Asn)/Glu-tRNA(Gln) amidotransferase A subunit family amidase